MIKGGQFYVINSQLFFIPKHFIFSIKCGGKTKVMHTKLEKYPYPVRGKTRGLVGHIPETKYKKTKTTGNEKTKINK